MGGKVGQIYEIPGTVFQHRKLRMELENHSWAVRVRLFGISHVFESSVWQTTMNPYISELGKFHVTECSRRLNQSEFRQAF